MIAFLYMALIAAFTSGFFTYNGFELYRRGK